MPRISNDFNGQTVITKLNEDVLKVFHAGRQDIEARPVWKPMHMQPVFHECEVVGGGVAEELFEHGLCLPSGSNLSEADLTRVAAAVRLLRR